MAKCTNCSFELPADAAFCPNCSTRVVKAEPTWPPRAQTGNIDDILTVMSSGDVNNASDLSEGAEFHSRYIIERKLGAGAMGVVYLANDKVTSRKVALKLINPALVNSPSARQRFIREGMIARDVRHPNIIAMYDVSEAEGQVYLVMEYLPGSTLREWLHEILQASEDVPFDSAKAIIRNILEGLTAAHATGTVHRDLKPENIIMMGKPGDGNCNLKILDFGIARAIGDGGGKQLATTSLYSGTPLYMAPEQKTAADTVGPPADLYAVTAIFYELLIGVAPGGQWAPPSRERKDLPPAIDAVIEKGLSSRPRSRYQTAKEYLDVLAGISAGEVKPLPQPLPTPTPIPPPPPQEPKSWWKWSPAWEFWKKLSKTQRWLVVAAGVVLILILAMSQDKPTYNTEDETTGSIPASNVIPTTPATTPVKPPPPPPPPQTANISGRWYDALTNTTITLAEVRINQNGNSVTGGMFDQNGVQTGEFSGQMNGSTLRYDWTSNFGRGSGRGELRPDGRHIDIVVGSAGSNITESHVLHLNHLPTQ